MIFEPVALRGREPLAASSTRHLFLHPDSPDLLIKVHKLASERALGESGLTRWQKRSWRFQFFSGILREFEGYLAHHYAADNPFLPYIMPVHGLIQTDRGVGVLMDAARTESGELAPTVRQLFMEKAITPARAELLSGFLQAVMATNEVIGDLNLDNVVLVTEPGGRESLRLVDGLGERTWIPIQRWSSFARKRQKVRFVRKVQARCERAGIENRSLRQLLQKS